MPTIVACKNDKIIPFDNFIIKVVCTVMLAASQTKLLQNEREQFHFLSNILNDVLCWLLEICIHQLTTNITTAIITVHGVNETLI